MRRILATFTAVVLILLGSSVATAAAPAGVIPDTYTPEIASDPDDQSVELGMKFSPQSSGTLQSVQFYRNTATAGVQSVSVWDAAGNRLKRVSVAATGPVGWRTVPVAVALTAGRTYTVSVFDSNGHYPATNGYFTAARTVNGIKTPVSAGVYRYGSTSAFPSQSWNASSYLVDVVFSAGAATPSASPTPTPVPTTTVTPTPTPTPTAGVLSLPREPWWGGPAYYSAFAKANAAGWDQDAFFPIAVFFAKPSQAAALAAIGVNTFMGAEHDGSTVASMTSQGIDLLAQPEWTAAELGQDTNVVGWHLLDEPDMNNPGAPYADDESGILQKMRDLTATYRARNDGRFLQVNFGNGVLHTYWSTNNFAAEVGTVDVSSVDKYAYTSPPVDDVISGSPDWPSGRNPVGAWTYGWLQDQMDRTGTPAASKPNWVFVETARPYLTESDARTITVPRIGGAAWSGIIHGAQGIAYFQHNNDSSCGNYSLIDCGDALRNGVKALDAEIKSLAPVINTQGYVWNFGRGIDAALKVKDGSAYILAMTDGGSGTRTFTLPAGVNGTTAEVVGEGRSVTVSGGKFTDTFAAEYTHHVYRIALG